VILVFALGMACAWLPLRTWQFEHFLSVRSTELTEGRPARVHCNTTFDTMVDPAMLAAGHARWDTGEIAFQAPWCSVMMAYLRHPQRAYRAARLLGVPEAVARQNARDVFVLYQERGRGGSLQQQYYSAQCAPGLSLDEHLSDSSWAPP